MRALAHGRFQIAATVPPDLDYAIRHIIYYAAAVFYKGENPQPHPAPAVPRFDMPTAVGINIVRPIMKLLRWFLLIPVAAMAAVACGFGVGALFDYRSYDKEHIFLSLISPRGLAPQIIERLIPVALFVIIGTVIAPSRGKRVVVLLGVLGGIFGWPFGPGYSLAYGHVFYAASAGGTLLGCAIGLLTAFQWQARCRRETPNHTAEPTSPRLGGSS